MRYSCKPRQNPHPALEPGYLAREHFHKLRSFRARPDDAHLSSEDVDYLRKLIDVGSTKHAAQAGYTGVVHGRPYRPHLAFCVPDHRAELDDVELFSVLAKALLPVKHRSAIIQKDQQGNYRPQ